MHSIYAWVRMLFVALLAGAPLSALAADDSAKEQAQRQVQQPLNNAPLWREVRSGEPQFATIRGVETNVLIQSAGETWRRLRNGPITLYGGILLCTVLAAIVAFYAWKGQVKLHEGKTGRLIERFNSIERLTHWTAAISFSILGLTGLAMLFGKHILLPVFGYTLFSWLAVTCKNLHNFLGPLFLLSVIVMFFLFVKDNIPRAFDWLWIRKFGGLFSGEHVPSHRFNAGEKSWFWLGVVLLGVVVSASGLVLNFPNFEQGRTIMQLANVIHAIGAILIICLSLGHIYLGTIGMEGAYESMRHGHVDETWAKEHHEYWYNDAKHLASEPRKQTAAASGVAVKV